MARKWRVCRTCKGDKKVEVTTMVWEKGKGTREKKSVVVCPGCKGAGGIYLENV